jgi:hypothetical protein
MGDKLLLVLYQRLGLPGYRFLSSQVTNSTRRPMPISAMKLNQPEDRRPKPHGP